MGSDGGSLLKSRRPARWREERDRGLGTLDEIPVRDSLQIEPLDLGEDVVRIGLVQIVVRIRDDKATVVAIEQGFVAADEAAGTGPRVREAKNARQSGVRRARHHWKGAEAAAPDDQPEPARSTADRR